MSSCKSSQNKGEFKAPFEVEILELEKNIIKKFLSRTSLLRTDKVKRVCLFLPIKIKNLDNYRQQLMTRKVAYSDVSCRTSLQFIQE